MKYLFRILFLAFIYTSVFADGFNSLTLTPAEMQKLKKYFPVEDTSHLIWKGDPITIILPVGQEKRIIFSSQVSVDIKSALNTDQLRLLNDNKSLYFTALKSFSNTRIFVTLNETGEVLLIDLVTNDHASTETQYIDVKKINTLQNNNQMPTSATDTNLNLNEKEASYVDLIRFAWQQSYAPDRVVKNGVQYARAPMHTKAFVLGLMYGDKVIAFPQSAWVSGKHYVTAVILRNKYLHTARIDIHKDLCGDWQAAVLFPRSVLKPYGDKLYDSTMLLLVSNRPFGDVLGVCHGHA